MTKRELLNALKPFDEYDIVIIGDSVTGWSNIDEVKKEGGCLCIMADIHCPSRGEEMDSKEAHNRAVLFAQVDVNSSLLSRIESITTTEGETDE